MCLAIGTAYVERILLVQMHYHTKSCKKHGNNKCRFGIPRFPSDFTIMTQPIPEEIAKIEEETMRSINFLKIKFETELKIIESTVVEMKNYMVFLKLMKPYITGWKRLFLMSFLLKMKIL